MNDIRNMTFYEFIIIHIDKKYLSDINRVASRCVYKKAMKAL